ncbi:hypothetical protein ACFL2J_06635 [Candidatus Omnitrophota bacterium]
MFRINVDYIKLSQWIKMARYYLDKLEHSLGEAVFREKGKEIERRTGAERRSGIDRRLSNIEDPNEKK